MMYNPENSLQGYVLRTGVLATVVAGSIAVIWHLFKLLLDQENVVSSTTERVALISLYPIAFVVLLIARSSWLKIKTYVNERKGQVEHKAQKLLIDADGGVARVDKDQKIIYSSIKAHEIIAPNIKIVVGKTISELLFTRGVTKDNVKRFERMVLLQFSYPEYGLNFGDIDVDGDINNEKKRFNLKTLPVHDGAGRVQTVAIIVKDISADKALLEKLHDQAEQDPLTGLPNRLGFDRFMEHFPHIAEKDQKNVLCFLDLDKFKNVNDTAGHIAGDELLRQLADIFSDSIRGTDKLARLGGDEFVIFLPRCNIDSARKILENIISRVTSHRFNWEDKSFVVGVSIGAIEFDSGVSVSELRRLAEIADQACYVAKQRGRNQLYVPDTQMGVDAAFKERDSWLDMIRSSLSGNTFDLYVQPIIPLKATKKSSDRRRYEVFIRMPYKDKIFTPGSFFPAAERHGLIGELDRWVVRHALKKISFILATADDGIRREFTVNLSSMSLQDETFPDFLLQELKQSGVNASLLCFELSESSLISNFSYARKLLTKLAILGCKTSLDDFGSGLSSLNHIRDLPINYLKIDGIFIKNLESDKTDAAMVHALQHMCRVMNMETVAETVETEKTAVLLRRLGVDYAQGYYCGKPLAMDRLAAAMV